MPRRGPQRLGGLERGCLSLGVVTADERISLRLALRQRRRGERVQPGEDRPGNDLLDPLGQREWVRAGKREALDDAELARDAQERGLAERVGQLECGRQRSCRVGRKHDEAGADPDAALTELNASIAKYGAGP